MSARRKLVCLRNVFVNLFFHPVVRFAEGAPVLFCELVYLFSHELTLQNFVGLGYAWIYSFTISGCVFIWHSATDNILLYSDLMSQGARNYRLYELSYWFTKLELSPQDTIFNFKKIETIHQWMFLRFNRIHVAGYSPLYEGDPHPPGPAVYTSSVNTWILTHFSPSNMGGPQKFQLLHEIGHASAYNISRQVEHSTAMVYVWLSSLPYILWRASLVSLPEVLIFLLVISFLFLSIYQLRMTNLDVSRLTNEIEADYFAFQHGKREWLCESRMSDIDLASRFCKYKDISSNDLRCRVSAFVKCLDAKRRYASLPDLEELLPRVWGQNLIHAIRFTLSMILAAFAYSYFAQSVNAAGLLLLILMSCALWLGVATFDAFVSDFYSIRIRGYKLRPATLGFMPEIIKGIFLGAHLGAGKKRHPKFDDTLQEQLLREAYARNNENLDLEEERYRNSLFTADEVDIDFRRDTRHLYLFHGKIVNYSIEVVEYSRSSFTAYFCYSKSVRLSLGFEIPIKVRHAWETCDTVSICRTKDGTAVELVKIKLVQVD